MRDTKRVYRIRKDLGMTTTLRILLVAAFLLTSAGRALAGSIFDLTKAPTTSPATHPGDESRSLWHDPALLVPWDSASRGVFRLTSGSAIMRNARPATGAAQSPATQ